MCVVNYNIAIAIGKGIVLANDRTLLNEKGGSLNLDFFMVSINFSKNWLYQKTSNNRKAAFDSLFSERDGFLLSLGY